MHDKVLYHELELFVDWQYKFEVAKETYLMLYTGPTIQCGVGFYSQRDERSIDGTLIPAIAASDRYKTDDADLLLKRLNITWHSTVDIRRKLYPEPGPLRHAECLLQTLPCYGN